MGRPPGATTSKRGSLRCGAPVARDVTEHCPQRLWIELVEPFEANAALAAVDALERGEQAGFDSAAHWYSVGARAFKAEEFGSAADLFQRSIAIDAETPDPHRSLAETLVRLDRESEAVGHFERYLELKPSAADADQVRSEIERISQG